MARPGIARRIVRFSLSMIAILLVLAVAVSILARRWPLTP